MHAISFATLLIALESTHVSKCCSGSNWMRTTTSRVDLKSGDIVGQWQPTGRARRESDEVEG